MTKLAPSKPSRSPKRRTVSQADFRAKISQYCREAAQGTWHTRVTDSSGKRFMVVCSSDEEPDAFIDLSITEVKHIVARICSHVKSGVSFRVASKRGKEHAILRPFRGYSDPLKERLQDFWADEVTNQMREELEEQQGKRMEELIRNLQEERNHRDEQIETMMKWTRHVVRMALGHRTPSQAEMDQDGREDDPGDSLNDSPT